MKTPGLISAAILLGSCISAFSARPGTNHKTPEERYQKIKQAIQTILDGPGLNIPFYPDAPRLYDLKYCFNGSDLLPDSDPRVVPTTIALYVGLYKELLDKLHIPHSIADQTFTSMEALAIETLKKPALRPKQQYHWNFKTLDNQLLPLQVRLCDALRAYARNRPGMPKFMVMGECGAGEAQIMVTTLPPGGTVSYIPLFQYTLCERRGIDPKDPDKCEGWLTAPSLKLDIVGVYHFFVVWPDGKSKRTKSAVHGIDDIIIRQ